MLKHFLPDEHVQNILDITPEMLVERGVKGIVTDLDNTLVEWDRPEATPELIKWFKSIKEKGILITIVSNNTQQRVKSFSDPVEIPFIYSARKPMTKAFKRALRDMNLRNEEVVVIGDQLLTDVLGGNRLGLHTILVVPVASSDGVWTRFNRKLERIILSWMKRKGMIHWEE
ncbi:YqeG family HAD IIIA-type phosphatase [Fictibacillus barbaricus]|jgi:HAD superfamily phosphatase (TIGR01668 family)|uniref:HAD superfamily phosphatase (TIGR01668 family) n=1 Tax=Fictibacillus barbaricus TaxID=182136 RepID=A0ABU1U067_9BACL|nr:YqeG family HAD IIIA-type phosphatase [Fictibacillus barbaricus]MDR7072830.1 HAD superfamily phosphatase (TIGR01668 family) [Fictibacillus barbaricus]